MARLLYILTRFIFLSQLLCMAGSANSLNISLNQNGGEVSNKEILEIASKHTDETAQKPFNPTDKIYTLDNPIDVINANHANWNEQILKQGSDSLKNAPDLPYDGNVVNALENAKEKIRLDTENSDVYAALQQKRLIWGAIISIIALVVIFFIIKALLRKLKNITSKTSERIHEYRVQKIAEDEAIRATVNKAVQENDGELDKLQSLINNAVSKGDTETAKALLEILEKQKQKK